MDRWVQYRHVHDQETTERWGKRTNLTSLQLNPGCKENTSKLRQLHCSQREYLQWVLTVHLVHKHLFQWLRHYFTYTFTGILTTYWLCIWQSLAELITSQVLRSLRSLDVNQKGPLASPRVESEGWRRKGRWMASEPLIENSSYNPNFGITGSFLSHCNIGSIMSKDHHVTQHV